MSRLRPYVKPLLVGLVGALIAVALAHAYEDHQRTHLIDSWGASIEARLKEAKIK